MTVLVKNLLAQAVEMSTESDSKPRNLLKQERVPRRVALKVAGGLLLSGLPFAAPAQAKRVKKVIVAGAGIAGLSCAYELTRRGHDVTVLEASNRTGGHVRTVQEGLRDGLYVDAGAEHFTQPGYERYWEYVREFNLTALPYPRRNHILRVLEGKMCSEEDLQRASVLSSLGCNAKETEFLVRHAWWELPSLYFDPYLERFSDEYRPFDAKLNHLDRMTMDEWLKGEGASPAAIRYIGGARVSALHVLWHAAILKLRGVPLFPVKVFRLKGGNQSMTDAFAARLGERVRLERPITRIEHGRSGVRVAYLESGEQKTMEAEYLVCCMSAVMLRQIPVKPGWPESKRYAIATVPYYTASRPYFQSRSRFWEADGVSPNIEFNEHALNHAWSSGDDVDTARGLLVATADAMTTGESAVKVFRRYYPGRSENIEKVFVHDWSQDPWVMACETLNYGPGELMRLWPALSEPHGRIFFAGAYADNLNWGQEAATRSANRAAERIDSEA
jgi:monoamine oxidase